MGVLDRLQRQANESQTSDEQALERYRYLLRTAPPEAIEQAHAEAFAQLTPQQRAMALKELSQGLPPAEQAAAPTQADPQTLARLATRAELRQPGTMERIFGGRGLGGMSFGGMFAGGLLSSIAGAFIGSAIAHQFLGDFHGGDSGGYREAEAARAQIDSNAGEDYSGGDADDDFGDGGGGDDVGGDFGDV